MGVSFSCPFSASCDLEDGLQSIIPEPTSFGGSQDEELKTTQRSFSFKGLDSELKITRTLSPIKMVLGGSLSFKQREILETMISIEIDSVAKEDALNKTHNEILTGMHKQSPRSDNISFNVPKSPSEEGADCPKHHAAVKLQKVYKSFRTRRKLADGAVLVEQSWWKLLDFAELKHNTISFFDHENQETAFSRWSRAKAKAAKVGKGLSKSDKARNLAVQHWLEAIDARHRYGHNLHFYYDKWHESQSREPFFYWLDIGEGKEVNLINTCPRTMLQQQCIKYLGPMERKAYEVVIKGEKLFFEQSGEILDTTADSHSKWIFVLSTSKRLYVGKKKKGTFQHSSFLAGGATSAAGRLVVEKGILKAVSRHSGHYKPTAENFQDFLSYLTANSVDLTGVEMDLVNDDDPSNCREKGRRLSSRNLAEDELNQGSSLQMDKIISPEELIGDKMEATKQVTAPSTEEAKPYRCSLKHNMSLPHLEIPKWGDGLFKAMAGEEEESEDEEEIVSKEKNLPLIDSHEETNSYQLGKQLSCKWITGAGPRIGCLRDCPSELQLHSLELVGLSPSCSDGFRSSRTL